MSHFYQKPFVILPLLSLLAFSPKELDQHFSGRSIASLEAKKVLSIEQFKIDSSELRKLIHIEEKKTDADNVKSLIIIKGLNLKLNQLEKDLKKFATNSPNSPTKSEDIKFLINEIAESKKLVQPLLAKAENKKPVEKKENLATKDSLDNKDHSDSKASKEDKDHSPEAVESKEGPKSDKKEEIIVSDKKEDKKPSEEKHVCDEKTSPVMNSQLEMLIVQQNNLMMMMMNNMTQMMIQNNNRLWQTPSVPNDVLYRYAPGNNQQPNYVYTQNPAPQSISEQQMGPQNGIPGVSGQWNLAPQPQFNLDPRYTPMNVNPGQFGIGQFGYNFSQQIQPQVAMNNQSIPQQMPLQMPEQAPLPQTFVPNFSNNYQGHLLQ